MLMELLFNSRVVILVGATRLDAMKPFFFPKANPETAIFVPRTKGRPYTLMVWRKHNG